MHSRSLRRFQIHLFVHSFIHSIIHSIEWFFFGKIFPLRYFLQTSLYGSGYCFKFVRMLYTVDEALKRICSPLSKSNRVLRTKHFPAQLFNILLWSNFLWGSVTLRNYGQTEGIEPCSKNKQTQTRRKKTGMNFKWTLLKKLL